MFLRIATLAVLLLSAQSAAAQSVVIFAFEDSKIVNSGKQHDLDLYYVLAYEGNHIEKGELIQIGRQRLTPHIQGASMANYTFTDDGRLTINWNPVGNEKFGATEIGQLTPKAGSNIRYEYRIEKHDDKSQVGERMSVRIVALNQVPRWVQGILWNYRQTKMSPQERVLYHRLQAEQLRATSKIMDGYFDAMD